MGLGFYKPLEGKDYTWYKVVYIYVYIANSVNICYLPPFTFEPQKSVDFGGERSPELPTFAAVSG